MWWLYEILYVIGFLLYLPIALLRKRIPHNDWSMRLGRYPQSFSQSLSFKNPIWIHAVSVGEILAAQPLIEELLARYPDQGLIISTITPTGNEVAKKRFGDRISVIYFPLDLSFCINRALKQIKPKCLLLMESELWPNTIRIAKKRGVRVAVINGRISEKAFGTYRHIRFLTSSLLNSVDLYLMQTDVDAKRIIDSGVDVSRVRIAGNLKWEASLRVRPKVKDIEETALHIGLKAKELLLVAGSTHKGEEEPLIQSIKSLKEQGKDMRLLIAPRHLERIKDVETLVKKHDLRSIRCSKGSPSSEWDVAIVDEMGKLLLYYSLATITFVGGSLIPHGGQNPLEPASLGKPIMFGPSMNNFSQIAEELINHQAACQIPDGSRLVPAIKELLDRSETTKQMGELAWQLVQSSAGATQRTVDALNPLITGTLERA